jgi:hypothetical protein
MTSYRQNLDGEWSPDGVYVRTQAEQLVLSSRDRSAVDIDEYAKAVIAYSKSSAEISRRSAIDRRLNILRDAWGPLLKAALENWLRPEIQDLVMGEHRDQLDLSRNPAKHIWNEHSVLYKLPPKRTTPDNNGDIEKYNTLLKDTNFNGFWQIVELLLNSCNEVVIWPDVIKYNNKKIIRHRVEAGNAITAIPMAEDRSLIECYLHTYEYNDLFEGKKIKYILWTNDWHALYEEERSGEIKRVGYIDPELYPEYSDVANPYGEMPHTHIRLIDWPDGPWDITTNEDLVDLTIHGGKERAFYRYLQKVSGFKQGVFTGNIDKLGQFILDPGYSAKAEGDDVKFTVVDWSVPLRERLQCMMDDELSAAAAHGINPQRYKRTGDYQTSYAAKNAERGLGEIRQKNIPILGMAENSYKRKLCIVAARHGFENTSDPDVPIEITYHPIELPEDPKAQVELDRMEIAMGVKSQLDLVQRAHPEWDEDKCRQYLIKTLETISWIAEEKIKRNVADDPTVQTASAQANGAMGHVIRDGTSSQPEAGPAE